MTRCTLRIFFSEFLDILENDFWPTGAYTPRSQSGFSIPIALLLFVDFSYLFLRTLFRPIPTLLSSGIETRRTVG
jgi:hypothetical protein